MGMKKGQKQYDAFHIKVRGLQEAGLTCRKIAEEMEFL